MGETHDEWVKRMSKTEYKATLCDVKGCSDIATHTLSIYHVPHGVVKFHTCSFHYDKHFEATWEQFQPHVKAYNEYKG